MYDFMYYNRKFKLKITMLLFYRMFRKVVHEALVEVLAVEDPEIDESVQFTGVELNIWDSEIPEESQNLGEQNSLFKLDTAPVKAAFNRQLPKYTQVNNILVKLYVYTCYVSYIIRVALKGHTVVAFSLHNCKVQFTRTAAGKRTTWKCNYIP